MISVQWYVGMKVVCIDAEWRPYDPEGWPPCPLVEGKVYTITRIHPNTFGVYSGPTRLKFCVEVAETVNPFDQILGPAREARGFNAGRFRPVVERKTDISVFTRMLKEDKQLVDA